MYSYKSDYIVVHVLFMKITFPILLFPIIEYILLYKY